MSQEYAARNEELEKRLFQLEQELATLRAAYNHEQTLAKEVNLLDPPPAALLQRMAIQQRISAAGRAVLQRLADKPDLNTFLGQVLTVAAEEFRACGASLWLYDQPSDKVKLLVVYTEEGLVMPPPPDRRDKLWQIDVGGLKRGQITTHHAPHFEGVVEEFKPNLLARGIVAALCVPLFLGEALQGLLTLTFRQERYLMLEETQLAEALANYTVLALELTRLAEETRQTAVLHEQRLAAQERAVQLKRANDALKSNLDTLATRPDLDHFLGQILIAVTQELTADSSMLWLNNSAQTRLGTTYLKYENNLLVKCGPGLVNNSGLSRSRLLLPELTVITRLSEGTRNGLTRTELEEMSRGGVTSWVSIPLWLGDQLRGAVTLRFRRQCEVSQSQIELVQTLVNQATLALELNRLSEEARQAAQEVAVSEERTRMARDIHDTLAQAFTGVRMQLEAADLLLETEPETARACIERALALTQQGLSQARQSVLALREDSEKYPELSVALAATVQQMTLATGVQAETVVQGSPYRLEAQANSALLRIAQEAITNVLRHAQATHFRVYIMFSPQKVQLAITDNGCGFDPAVQSAGFGLRGMRERAERLGATLSVVSQPGQGTQVTLIFPVIGSVEPGK